MTDIKRYKPELYSYDKPFMEPDPDGEYVTYEDHLKIVKALNTKIGNLGWQVSELNDEIDNADPRGGY